MIRMTIIACFQRYNQLSIIYNQSLGAAHRVSAVKAFIAGAVADGNRAANITGRGIIAEMLELGVKLLQNLRLSSLDCALDRLQLTG